jgi:hypothetical protein
MCARKYANLSVFTSGNSKFQNLIFLTHTQLEYNIHCPGTKVVLHCITVIVHFTTSLEKLTNMTCMKAAST